MPFDPTDPDTKAALAEAIETATSGLKTKVEELIGDNKKLKADLRKTQEISPDDLAKLEADNDKLRADLTAAQKVAKDATTAAEKATKALEGEAGFTHKLLVENGLREALVANGVTNPVHQKAALALLSSGVQIAAEGDSRVAKFGDKPLADAVKEWAVGDEGKHFVAAPANGGGGAPGGSGSGAGVKTVTRSQFDAMDQSARAGFFKDGGKVADVAA